VKYSRNEIATLTRGFDRVKESFSIGFKINCFVNFRGERESVSFRKKESAKKKTLFLLFVKIFFLMP